MVFGIIAAILLLASLVVTGYERMNILKLNANLDKKITVLCLKLICISFTLLFQSGAMFYLIISEANLLFDTVITIALIVWEFYTIIKLDRTVKEKTKIKENGED